MQFFRHFAGPFIMLTVFVGLTVLGLATGGAGWVAASLLCAWPLLFAVTAWTLRGLRDSYRLVPKQTTVRSRNQAVPEVFG